MIKLRLVGKSSDNSHLIFTSKKRGRRGSHLVAVDEKLFAALEEVVRERRRAERGGVRLAASRQQAARPEPKLPPREIQRRLRAGAAPERVAKEAGVGVDYVAQFQTAVMYERMGVVQQARTRRLQKARLGHSGLPLGEAVSRNLRARRVRLDEDDFERAWDATRQESQPWVISLTFRYRGRLQRAVWRYNPQNHDLVAANRLANDLGWVPNGQPVEREAPARASGRQPSRGRRGRKPSPRAAKARRPRGRKAAVAPRPKRTRPRPRRAATLRRAGASRRSRRPAARARRTPARRRR